MYGDQANRQIVTNYIIIRLFFTAQPLQQASLKGSLVLEIGAGTGTVDPNVRGEVRCGSWKDITFQPNVRGGVSYGFPAKR